MEIIQFLYKSKLFEKKWIGWKEVLDEMLNVGNASMHDRIYDLERKVESQENELVCFAFTYKVN